MATFLETPVSITTNTGTNSVWRDVDLSADIPSGATGAILLAKGPASGSVGCGWRKNGSTDTVTGTVSTGRQYQVLVGLDVDRIIEVVSSNVAVSYELYLIGYFGDEAVFFDNAISYGALTTTYTDKDIASDTGSDTAIAAIVKVLDGYRCGFRVNGSSDTLDRDSSNGLHYNIVGVDGSEIFEARGNQTLYLLGYIKSGLTWHTNAIDRSTATTGSFEAVTVTGGGGGYIFQQISTAGTITVRDSGQTIDPYVRPSDNGSGQVTVGDSPEQKISATTADLYELGYFEAEAGGDTGLGAKRMLTLGVA